MKQLKKLLIALLMVPALSFANEGGFALDKAPNRSNDLAALQNGARMFVNYCLNCHGAASLRYNKLRDLGLSEEQIQDNLLFSGSKVGDLMKVTMTPADGKAWFGASPPDLSVIIRAKASELGSGSDWVYTYLRTFYKDDTRPTGWNNMVFPNVGMPHVLWELQGVRNAKFVEEKDPHDPAKTIKKFEGFEQVKAGKLKPEEYDSEVADLVAFMDWMAEPVKQKRQQLGVWVLLFLFGLTFLAWRLNKLFWKDIK